MSLLTRFIKKSDQAAVWYLRNLGTTTAVGTLSGVGMGGYVQATTDPSYRYGGDSSILFFGLMGFFAGSIYPVIAVGGTSYGLGYGIGRARSTMASKK